MCSTDCGHAAFVEILERRDAGVAIEPGPDHLADVLSFLKRRLGNAGEAVQGDHVADGEHFRMAGERAVGFDHDSAGSIGLGTGRRGEHLRQRRRLHTCGPHFGPGFDALLTVVIPDGDPIRVDLGGHRGTPHFDTHPLESPRGVPLKALVEGTKDCRAGLDEHDPRLTRVDPTVIAGQHAMCQLGDLADDLDACRAGPHHDEGEIGFAFRRVGCQLRHFERTQDVIPQVPSILQRLHSGRELRPLVVPEIRMGRTGRHHQGVVRQRYSCSVRRDCRKRFAPCRSRSTTSPSTTLVFFCFCTTRRSAGAIKPSGRMPVAT